ncbi:MAG: flagellar biosynthesis protein FlhB [Spirochaetes bacterium]|nr:flagellar biosynthesis protein FlhB [Spirochaetota bacterium]MBU1081744.1 flagellar biosynthesis protein FlhB [Spirochaetota bacterium]
MTRGYGDIARIHLQWFAPEDEGKTEDPTEYRLKKEREEGRVAKSPDLVAAIGLLLAAVALAIVGPWMFVTLRDMTRWFLTVSIEIDPTTDAAPLARAFLSYFSRLVIPIAAVAMVAGVFGNVLQTGFLFTTKPLRPDFKKVVPKFGQYFKRTLFSGEAVFNLAKSLFKIGVIGVVAYLNITAELPRLTRLYSSTVWNSAVFLAGVVIRIIIEAAILMLVLAVPDYIFQRQQFKKRLKMTKQEVKEERKMFEGDPLVKGRLKERMREIMSKNIAVNVPKADVVVTNPTHFAIAIEFDPLTMAVPTVTAKGADEMAFRIRSIAKEAGVPVIENRPLARALYAEAEVGDAIPEAYYDAISKVLAHVARIDKRVAAKYASMGT